uniref:Uncharacterized protein n=1 Tax=Anguilla anguilla TaxID=7936 RepID=A0A0E9TWX6_ANGAN
MGTAHRVMAGAGFADRSIRSSVQ